MTKFHSFWLRYLSGGVTDTMPPNERNKVCITRGASLSLALLCPIFAALNLTKSYSSLALINLACTALGLICLFLVSRKIIGTAVVLLVYGGCILFFFSGLIFHNGMEYTLLLGMLGAVFMFDSFPARLLAAVTNGAGFLAVKILHFGSSTPGLFPLPRYAFNVFTFLVCYYLILEIVLTVNRNYQLAIERQNAALAQQRRQLDEERTRLIARTGELQTANQAKEKLFSIVAHDLRGPVGNLRSSLELLDSQDLSRDDFRDMIPDLKIGVDLAYECLDTLLLWSAQQLREIKPIFTEVSLESAARESAALLDDLARHKNIAIRNTIPEEARVWADETQVGSIFRNLVSNAIKFSPAGGVVEISAARAADGWCVTISDDGVGMPAEQVRQLLESSNVKSTAGTENEKGFGLGLRICREFIQTNRGSLSIESQKGLGSSFHFTLPSAPLDAATSSQVPLQTLA